MANFETSTRVHTYLRPGQFEFKDLSHLDGLGQLRAVFEGDAPPPPIASTLGFTRFHAERGRTEVTITVEEFHYNPSGTVHGGIIAAILDTAAGTAVHSLLEVGESFTSLDLTIKFLRPLTLASGEIRALGEVIHRGRRTALGKGQLYDSSGKLAAHALSTCMILG